MVARRITDFTGHLIATDLARIRHPVGNDTWGTSGLELAVDLVAVGRPVFVIVKKGSG